MPFVSFEGVDGAGKTTQLSRLADWLEGAGQPVLRTKEPDGGRLGAEVRAMLTRDRIAPLDAVEELLLVSAARFDHVRSVIRPALTAGTWVLCDRFFDSTFALQVHASRLPSDVFEAVNHVVVEATVPDLTFILDLDPEVAAARRLGRMYESSDPAEQTRNFERVWSGFRILAAEEPRRCRLVDASQDLESVARTILAIVRASGLLSRPD